MNSDTSPSAYGDIDDLSQAPTSRDAETDVEHLHRAISRESPDPGEGRERIPRWLIVLALAIWFWAGRYLGRTGGTFDTRTHLAFGRFARDATVTAAARDASRTAAESPVERGRQLYAQHCQSCHQENGRGLEEIFPPLIGSEWVTGPPGRLIRILLNGLEGPVQVAGATYSGRMPGWREPLSDQDIAGVATYIRQWSPNAASPVDVAAVTAVRQATASRTQPWTASQLQAIKEEPGLRPDANAKAGKKP